jgi:hypothetical protein
MFRQQGEFFHPTASTAASADPGDTKFMQCAEVAQADYIGTGNKRHFPEPASGVTSIVSAESCLIGSQWKSDDELRSAAVIRNHAARHGP